MYQKARIGYITPGKEAELNREDRVREPLSFISSSKRESALKKFSPVEFGKGKIIFFQNEPADHLYLLTGGTVEISNINEDGRVYIHEFLKAGDLFGEGLIYGQANYPYSAQVREDASALRAGRDAVEGLMRDYDGFKEEMLEVLGKKVDLAFHKLKCIAGEKVDRRIVCVLMKYVDLGGIDSSCGMVIDTPLTNKDIAGLIGSTEETVSRVMSKLKKGNVIGTENKHIVVKDKEALADFFSGL